MHYYRLPNAELSKRETTLAQLIAEGYTGKEIGLQMGLTKDTVKVYSVGIYRKLNLNSWGNPRVRLTNWVRDKCPGRPSR